MRNHVTATRTDEINKAYTNAGITPEEFIKANKEAFDIRIREDYLAYHLVENGMVLTVYMWRESNHWNVKS